MWKNFENKEIGVFFRAANYRNNGPFWFTFQAANNNGIFVSPGREALEDFLEDLETKPFTCRFYPWGIIDCLGLRGVSNNISRDILPDVVTQSAGQ